MAKAFLLFATIIKDKLNKPTSWEGLRAWNVNVSLMSVALTFVYTVQYCTLLGWFFP